MTLKVEYPSLDGFLRDYTINVSAGGLLLSTARDLRETDRVEMRLSFPGLLEPVLLAGEVRWVATETGNGPMRQVGVAFDTRDRATLAALDAVLTCLRSHDTPPTGPVRLVLAHSQPQSARMLRDGLAAMGLRKRLSTSFDTVIYDDGREALESLEREGAELLVVDMALETIDGLELLRRVRAQRRFDAMPMVALVPLEERELAFEAGADFCLQVPFRLQQLLDTVFKLLVFARRRGGD